MLSNRGIVLDACEAVGVDRSTAYDHKNNDPEFAKAWNEALEAGVDVMEREAFRRAVHGVQKPVFYQGNICGTVQEYSDAMLSLLLKAKRFKDVDSSHVSITTPVTVKLDGPLAEWAK